MLVRVVGKECGCRRCCAATLTAKDASTAAAVTTAIAAGSAGEGTQVLAAGCVVFLAVGKLCGSR